MFSFELLVQQYVEKFNHRHFPNSLPSLYDPAEYFLQIGGKRIRPVMCLMGNELFGAINPDAWHAADAIELFHNFTLIHDDIMDKAPLRRGMQTLHTKYNDATALLAGDVMMIAAYEALNKINPAYLPQILHIFNKTAKEVCEGQQLDMDFENKPQVSFEEYIHMIALKTSVLLAASLKMGAVLGGAGEGNQEHLYEFGKNLGIAFQVQDDYLDAFGQPEKVGKQPGGDIIANKKTFLLIRAMETADEVQQNELQRLLQTNPKDKVPAMLELYKACEVDSWSKELKQTYLDKAFFHLEEIAVTSSRKQALKDLAYFLIQREH